MSELDNKLSVLETLLTKNGSNHLFVRFQTRERHITGPLQGLSVDGNGTVTCFFGESLKTDVVDIPKSDLVDVAVFCNAERQPVFLKDFDAEVGESGSELLRQPESLPGDGIGSNVLEQAREDAVAAYQENVEVFESLRE